MIYDMCVYMRAYVHEQAAQAETHLRSYQTHFH